jgi:hypothetical protein
MASWTNLTDAILGIGKPLTYVIARAWRDNAIAIAEGAVGAPRVVVPTAISTAETNTQKTLVPDGAGGVAWALSPAAPNVVLLFTASGTATIPTGTRIKLTVIGGGGTALSGGGGTAGSDSTATDGTTTVTAGYGGNNGAGNGSSSGGTGYTIPTIGGGGSFGGPGPFGSYGRGLNGTASTNTGGGNSGQARVVSMVMASGTLTVTIGTTGANNGAVIVEY